MSENKIKVVIDSDLEDLIPGFLENRTTDIDKLSAALSENDFQTIQSIGHNLKGLGGGYGFELMSDIGASIESSAKEESVEAISELINQLSDYLKQIDIVFE